ncbi:colicin E5-related ribonuclease, partial [Acetobacter indonesiensis]
TVKESDSLTKQLINDAIQAQVFSVESDGSENNEPVSGSANSQVDASSSLEVAGNDTQNPAGVTTQVYKRGSPKDPYANYTANPGFGSSEKNDPDASAQYSIKENVTGYSPDSAGSAVSVSGEGTVAPESEGGSLSKEDEQTPLRNDVVNNKNGFSIDGKIREQMAGRGWTDAGIEKIIEKGPTGTSTDKRSASKAPDGVPRDDTATVYGNKSGYIVINDRTGEVVQLSDKNDKSWIPDGRIKWK